MTLRRYEATFGEQTLVVTTFETSDGKIEDYLVAAND